MSWLVDQNLYTERSNVSVCKRVFADHVLKSRVKAGLSQADLAAKTGISETTIRNIERGRKETRLSYAVRIANELDFSLGEVQ